MERNPESRNLNSPWLVKANGRLLGPFPKEEVVKRLRSKEFVLLDEIAQPLQRWRYVRDEPQFARVVEDLRRGAYAGREDTQTTSMTIESNTASVTAEISPELDSFSRTEELDAAGNVLDAEFTEKIDVASQASAISGKVKSYAFGADQKVQARVKSSTRFVWPLTIFLLAVLAGMFYLTHLKKLPQAKPMKFEELIRNGVDAKRVGQLAKAAEYFKKAQVLRPDDPDINLLLAPILIANEGQTVEGKRLLQRVLSIKANPDEVCQSKTAMGLASLLDGNLEEANQSLSDALVAEKNFYPALANMGSVALLRADFRSAGEYYQSAIDEDSHDSALILLLARAQLDSIEKKMKGAPLPTDVENTIRPALEFYDYRQEAFLLMAYAQILNGETNEVLSSVDSLLDIDPTQTENHVHELLVYRRPIAWDMLVPICEKIYSKLSQYPHMRALEGLCYFKANNRLEGKKAFDDALLQSPKDSLIRSLYGALLLEMGQDKEAKAAMDLVSGDSNYELPQIMRARLCELQNDMSCAEKQWQQLLSMRTRSIEAMAGLGRVWLTSHEYKRAADMASSGLQLSATYAPLIKLQDAANHEKPLE